MLRNTHLAGALAFFLFIFQSCNSENRSTGAAYSESVSADTVASSSETTSLDVNEVPALASSARTIIRKADIRCRVADVFTATSGIEKLVNSLDGIVANSQLENQASALKTLPYNADSLKQIRSVSTTSRLTLKIPVAHLDTLLSAIASRASFIDARSLQLSDVTLQYLSNELKARASTENNTAQKAKVLAKKTNDAMVAGQYADQRDEAQIERKIENLSLKEQATFATIEVDLYQPERIDQLIVADMEKQLQPSFGQRMKSALGNGFVALQALFVLVVTIWPLWIIAVIILYFVKSRNAKWIKVPGLKH